MNEDEHIQHGERRNARRRPLAIALTITVVVLIVEVIGGIAANSLALLADAGHMATDAAALGLSLFAAWLASRPATPRRSYGFMRAEILAAAVNSTLLLIVSAYVFWEAFQRFSDPPAVESNLMLAVALVGLGANLVAAWVLSRGGGHQRDLNTRGAYLHVVGDLLGSLAAIVAALIILATGWDVADPILSVLIGGLIVFSAWRLLREAVDVLLETTPAHLNPAEIRRALISVPGVADVHDLHVWTVTSGVISASVHLEVTGAEPAASVLQTATELLQRQFGIAHATLQLEEYDPRTDRDRGCSLDTDDGLHACRVAVAQGD